MANFMECIDSKCLGALHFVDAQMQPKPKWLTIKSVAKDRPPAAGKNTPPKWITYFEEGKRGAFFSSGEYKKLANMLMCADTDGWIGAKVLISCGPKMYKGQEVMGMIILKAERANRNGASSSTSAEQQTAPAQQEPSNVTQTAEDPEDFER